MRQKTSRPFSLGVNLWKCYATGAETVFTGTSVQRNSQSMSTSLRVGLIGLGTVASGVAQILMEHSARTQLRAHRRIEVTRVAVRNLKKTRSVALPNSMLTTDPFSVVTADDVDVVVELMGGISPAKELVEAALEHGKDVVTANKALLCEHGASLFPKAKELGRCIAFEAAVAGGCPIIAAMGQSMTGNQITALRAIINGTSNFILTQMLHNNTSYDDAVREAQACGYAESDPSMDVKGIDAAQKLGILTQLAFGERVSLDRFPVQGIDELELEDLKFADELGYAIKLLATAKLVEGQLELHTQPTLIRKDRPLAQVDGPYNMVELTGDAVGKVWLSAMGAGQMATASAVVADIVDVAVGRTALTFPRLNLWQSDVRFPLQQREEIERRYYFRFHVEDRPHVIADIADILGRNGISLSSVIQKEARESDLGVSDTPIVPLVFMTHRAKEGKVRAAARELDHLNCVQPPWLCLPVSE